MTYAHAEALPDTIDAGQGLACIFGHIHKLSRVQADIAVAAVCSRRSPK